MFYTGIYKQLINIAWNDASEAIAESAAMLKQFHCDHFAMMFPYAKPVIWWLKSIEMFYEEGVTTLPPPCNLDQLDTPLLHLERKKRRPIQITDWPIWTKMTKSKYYVHYY